MKEPERIENTLSNYNDSFIQHEDNLYENEPDKLENE